MDVTPPAEYDDVNAAAVAAWTDETTARDRVRAVVQRIDEPTPAAEIATRARASEPVVRGTLTDLVDLGIVEAVDAGQGSLYKRHDQMYIYRQVLKLQAAYDERELLSELKTLKTTVQEFRDTYGVESPTELAGVLDPDDTDGWDDHTTWQTAEKNLYLTKAALSFHDATYSARESRPSGRAGIAP
ncbi:DUF7342 family protein [Halonotius pteroides]|uniref:ArsR family transcriptional regulator n=1 Tax=Halonotius pteroides TaxID=268735 RepID=A0A3A6Q4T7_9EURY|nr:ArsR family transcriptional regulator [Halonotius pteroides]RJX49373.1 ArsR family transcriptional regulator [Halonotius pteroides]